MPGGVPVRVGILAVQGAFVEHEASFVRAAQTEHCDITVTRVRRAADLQNLHGLVLPGGESTVMTRFLHKDGLAQSVRSWLHGDCHHPRRQIWGTCAGLILLADQITGNTKLNTSHALDTDQGQSSRRDLDSSQTRGAPADDDATMLLGGLSISVKRNSYGGQRDSFESDVFVSCAGLTGDSSRTEGSSCRGIFIRAPEIQSIYSDDVAVLATIATEQGKRVVAVEQGNILGTSFHPELTDDVRWHRYFLRRIVDTLT